MLVDAIKKLYRYWNLNYCKGQVIENVGLHNDPYFKYFSYPDFLAPHSGLIQIKKYAELEGASDLLQHFDKVSELTKRVKEELCRLLVTEFRYLAENAGIRDTPLRERKSNFHICSPHQFLSSRSF